MAHSLDLSVVVPLLNEEESLPELTEWLHRVGEEQGYNYEIIFVDDGSTDNSWKVINELREKSDRIRGLKFRRNYGKSAALHEGFQVAKGRVVITMDADLQDSPDEIPDLYRMVTEDGYDLVSGWKKKRFDPISKTIPTKLYNAVTRLISGIKLHDFNCGLKAYRYEVIKNIEVYGEMHRYIPVIAKWAGFKNIGEKVVQHRPRKYGTTKFGLSRFVKGPLDVLSITFVSQFGKRPMHFFGFAGAMCLTAGFIILLWLSLEKIVWNIGDIDDRPIFYFGILLLIVGTQLFSTGFLAELVARNSPHRNQYQIEEEV